VREYTPEQKEMLNHNNCPGYETFLTPNCLKEADYGYCPFLVDDLKGKYIWDTKCACCVNCKIECKKFYEKD
jgi:hypothetical protein